MDTRNFPYGHIHFSGLFDKYLCEDSISISVKFSLFNIIHGCIQVCRCLSRIVLRTTSFIVASFEFEGLYKKQISHEAIFTLVVYFIIALIKFSLFIIIIDF